MCVQMVGEASMSSSNPSSHTCSAGPPTLVPLQTGTIRNPAHWVSEEDEQALKVLQQARMADLERRRFNAVVGRGGSEERHKLEKQFRDLLRREIRELDALTEEYERSERSRLEMQRKHLDWEPLFLPKLAPVNQRPLSVDG